MDSNHKSATKTINELNHLQKKHDKKVKEQIKNALQKKEKE